MENFRLSMAEDDEDPLLQLCSLDEDKPVAAAAKTTTEVEAKLEGLALAPAEGESGGDDKLKPSMEEDKFVVLDLKTPFSGRGLAPGGGINAGANSAELGIFFKSDDLHKPSGTSSGEATSLAYQLDSLNQKLEDYQKDLEDFDEMWKTLEAAPTDSESEVN